MAGLKLLQLVVHNITLKSHLPSDSNDVLHCIRSGWSLTI